MSVVSYDSKKIIPAPNCAIAKRFDIDGAGNIIGNTYTLTLTGVLLAYKGSPNSSRVFWTLAGYPSDEAIEADSRLGALLRKTEALRDLFSEHGRELYIQAADASEPMKCNPRVIDINFAEGTWFDTVPYTITLEADKIYPIEENTFDAPIKEYTEEWNIETDDGSPESINLPRTYRLSHNISAVGKTFYNELGNLEDTAWENARAYVIPRLGLNNSFLLSSGIKDLPSFYGGYNHLRTENINIAAGGYSATETWVLASGSALEDFTIQIINEAETNRNSVKINGTITGLEVRSAGMSLTSSKFTNAETKFAQASGLAFGRCQNYSGYSLNLYPISETIGKNPVAGTITYDFAYNNRPYNLIPGAIAERIVISDTLPTELVAVIPVLGRTAGPVIQPINTSAETSRSLNIEFTLQTQVDFTNLITAFNTTKPTSLTNTIKTAADPANIAGVDDSYVQSDRETWNPIDGKYTREIIWIYQ